MLIAFTFIVACSYWHSVIMSAINRNVSNQPQSMFLSWNEMQQCISHVRILRILKNILDVQYTKARYSVKWQGYALERVFFGINYCNARFFFFHM